MTTSRRFCSGARPKGRAGRPGHSTTFIVIVSLRSTVQQDAAASTPCFSFSLVPGSPWGRGYVINPIITARWGQMRLASITGDDKVSMIA